MKVKILIENYIRNSDNYHNYNVIIINNNNSLDRLQKGFRLYAPSLDIKMLEHLQNITNPHAVPINKYGPVEDNPDSKAHRRALQSRQININSGIFLSPPSSSALP